MVFDGVKRVCGLAAGVGVCNLRQALVNLAMGGKRTAREDNPFGILLKDASGMCDGMLGYLQIG